MTPYERAAKVIATEHDIVSVVFSYIDRMNDATSEDPLEKIAAEMLDELNPAINKHLEAIGSM